MMCLVGWFCLLALCVFAVGGLIRLVLLVVGFFYCWFVV